MKFINLSTTAPRWAQISHTSRRLGLQATYDAKASSAEFCTLHKFQHGLGHAWPPDMLTQASQHPCHDSPSLTAQSYSHMAVQESAYSHWTY